MGLVIELHQNDSAPRVISSKGTLARNAEIDIEFVATKIYNTGRKKAHMQQRGQRGCSWVESKGCDCEWDQARAPNSSLVYIAPNDSIIGSKTWVRGLSKAESNHHLGGWWWEGAIGESSKLWNPGHRPLSLLSVSVFTHQLSQLASSSRAHYTKAWMVLKQKLWPK